VTTLFVTLPLVVLLLGLYRPAAAYLYCGNMLFLAGCATVNLVHTVLGGTTKSVTLVRDFLAVGHPGGSLEVTLGVYLDFYSSYMVWVVFVISSLVHLYSRWIRLEECSSLGSVIASCDAASAGRGPRFG